MSKWNHHNDIVNPNHVNLGQAGVKDASFAVMMTQLPGMLFKAAYERRIEEFSLAVEKTLKHEGGYRRGDVLMVFDELYARHLEHRAADLKNVPTLDYAETDRLVEAYRVALSGLPDLTAHATATQRKIYVDSHLTDIITLDRAAEVAYQSSSTHMHKIMGYLVDLLDLRSVKGVIASFEVGVQRYYAPAKVGYVRKDVLGALETVLADDWVVASSELEKSYMDGLRRVLNISGKVPENTHVIPRPYFKP